MTIRDLTFVPMIAPEAIQSRVTVIGAALKATHGEQTPIFISILSGAFVFAADLIRAFDAPCEVSFVKLSSYAGTQSTGGVQTVMGLEKSLEGRHVIVVEDIVDTGRTLHFFLDYLQQQNPSSVNTVTLLRKPDALQFQVELDHIGFDIEDRFVVGYGLDYDGLGRNLAGIMVLAPE